MTNNIEILDGEEWQSSQAIDEYAFFVDALNQLHSECIAIKSECKVLSEILIEKDFSSIAKNDFDKLLEVCIKLQNSKLNSLATRAAFYIKSHSNKHAIMKDDPRLQPYNSNELVLRFSEYLILALNDMTNSCFARDKNHQAPAKFGENHLRKSFKKATNKINQDLHSPKLIIEKKINGDYQYDYDSHGCADYFFAKNNSEDHDFSNVLATFEVKGPTRPSLLKGSKKNWYPKILKDVRKQLWRSLNFPHTSNFVVIIFKSSPELPSFNLANLLRKELESEFKELKVKLENCYWKEIDCQSELVFISILKVMLKNE
jgi:hypothetical protein